jgi:hypothetical protein
MELYWSITISRFPPLLRDFSDSEDGNVTVEKVPDQQLWVIEPTNTITSSNQFTASLSDVLSVLGSLNDVDRGLLQAGLHIRLFDANEFLLVFDRCLVKKIGSLDCEVSLVYVDLK